MAKLTSLKAVTNRLAACKVFNKMANYIGITPKNLKRSGGILIKAINGLTQMPSVKLNYDDITKAAIAKVGTQKELTHFSGLINFGTGQMHLMESGTCEKLAIKVDLYESKVNLKDGWYGFTVYYTGQESKFVEVSPWSGQFGGIPIEQSPIFENYMKELFCRLTKDIFFWQLKYERNLNLENDKEDKSALLTRHLSSKHKALVPKSMSNDELKDFLPKKISNQIFFSPQG
jgi:hypothetical protein